MAEQIKDGGPAYPRITKITSPSINDQRVHSAGGLTIRDYFAAKAMEGFNRQMVAYEWGDEVIEKAAAMAYKLADSMLRAREVKGDVQ